MKGMPMKPALILATLVLSAPLARAADSPQPCHSLQEFMSGSCDRRPLPAPTFSLMLESGALVPVLPVVNPIEFMNVVVGPNQGDMGTVPVDPLTKLSNTIEIPITDPNIKLGGQGIVCYRGPKMSNSARDAAVIDGTLHAFYCEAI